jgi:hypothetical protein
VKDEALSLTTRVWQAAERTDAGHLTAAESVCRAALLAGVLGDVERARAEATLARILLWQGRIDDAAQRNLVCPDADRETAAYVASIAVRVALATGDVFAAGQRARELLDAVGSETGPHGGGSPIQDRGLARVIALSAHARVLMATGDLAAIEANAAVAQATCSPMPLRFAYAAAALRRLSPRGRQTDGGRTRACIFGGWKLHPRRCDGHRATDEARRNTVTIWPRAAGRNLR